MKFVYGATFLPLKCSELELKNIVYNSIDKLDESFSFKQLCSQIKSDAEAENLFEKENNTEYSSILLNYRDRKTIQLVIWEMIWNRKLMIDLSIDENRSSFNDYYFIRL